MNSEDIRYISESYLQILSEQNADLEDLRKAAMNATLAGPSKEAQALMSTRTKNILGPEKLKAGIEAQKKVEAMKSGQYAPEPPKPAPVPVSTPEPPKPVPVPAPVPESPKPVPVSTPESPKPAPVPVSTPESPKPAPAISSQQQNLYNRATSGLSNSLTAGIARTRIKSTFGTMTPEQKAQFKSYLQTRPQKERDLYKFLDENHKVKTFQQFMEQIPTLSMHPKSSTEQQARSQQEHDRRVSLRQQRRHVHGELARAAEYERSAKERNPIV